MSTATNWTEILQINGVLFHNYIILYVLNAFRHILLSMQQLHFSLLTIFETY